jgi:hypothetical protein
METFAYLCCRFNQNKIMEEVLTIKETLSLWSEALLWTLIGIVFVKTWQYDKKVKFSIKYWIQNNILDVFRGILLTFVVLKLGDITIQLLKYMGVDFTSLNALFTEVGADPVQLSLVIAIISQYYLYKKSKSKTISE